MHLVVGDSLVSHSTSRMVEQVAELKKTNPAIVDPVLDAIEGVSMSAIHHLSNPRELGRYMNMNHHLLEVLGVGHPQLAKMVLAARSAGAFGAKITGAGGGGSMVALCPKQSETPGRGGHRSLRGTGDRDRYRYGRRAQGEECLNG